MMGVNTPYYVANESLKDIYLEDSYVLEIYERKNSIVFEMEFVLTETHKFFRTAKKGEQYCYRLGNLKFSSCSKTVLELSNHPPNVDSNGEKDLGNIDTFVKSEDRYLLEGSWGKLEAYCEKMSVNYYQQDPAP